MLSLFSVKNETLRFYESHAEASLRGVFVPHVSPSDFRGSPFARLSTLCQVKKDPSTLIKYLNYTMK
jgi:hypothetical protein